MIKKDEPSIAYKTDQEAFWAGNFGTEYIQRNQGDKLLASNINFFVNALRSAREVSTCIEFGANVGMNLKALKLLYPNLELSGIEINPNAARELAQVIPPDLVYNSSILDLNPGDLGSGIWDLGSGANKGCAYSYSS